MKRISYTAPFQKIACSSPELSGLHWNPQHDYRSVSRFLFRFWKQRATAAAKKRPSVCIVQVSGASAWRWRVKNFVACQRGAVYVFSIRNKHEGCRSNVLNSTLSFACASWNEFLCSAHKLAIKIHGESSLWTYTNRCCDRWMKWPETQIIIYACDKDDDARRRTSLIEMRKSERKW